MVPPREKFRKVYHLPSDQEYRRVPLLVEGGRMSVLRVKADSLVAGLMMQLEAERELKGKDVKENAKEG